MLAFINARLIDGTGNPALENAAILIDGDTVADVGRGLDIPAGSRIIDVGGNTVMPGLFDAHVHIGGSDSREGDQLVGLDKSEAFAEARRLLLAAGVTGIRSAGDFEASILELRAMEAAGEIRSPRVYTCGKCIQPVGGHPAYTVWVSDPDILENAISSPETADAARAEVRRQSALGADHIKLFLADDNYIEPGKKAPRLKPEVLFAAAEEAHLHGLKVMVHCQEPGFALEALEAGADSIEHLFCSGHELDPLPDGLAGTFKKNDAFLVPTLVSTMSLDPSKEARAAVFTAVKELFEAGVRLAVGTDYGTPLIPVDKAVHVEMELLAEAGIPPLSVIEAATRNGAELAGDSRLGLLEPGRLADMVVVRGNPLEDMSCMESVCIVVKNGEILSNTLN